MGKGVNKLENCKGKDHEVMPGRGKRLIRGMDSNGRGLNTVT